MIATGRNRLVNLKNHKNVKTKISVNTDNIVNTERIENLNGVSLQEKILGDVRDSAQNGSLEQITRNVESGLKNVPTNVVEIVSQCCAQI